MKPILKHFIFILAGALGVSFCGCQGYQNSWPYPEEVQTVYVEMFDTTSFRRGHEFTLTNAICKRIEAHTPYKIVSDRNIADSVLSGKMGVGNGVVATDYYTARPVEFETIVSVNVTWKDLNTGELLLEDKGVFASTSYSEQLGQTFEYSVSQAVNKAAIRVVEMMETPW